MLNRNTSSMPAHLIPDGQLRSQPTNYWKVHSSDNIPIKRYRERLEHSGLHIPKRCPATLRHRLPAIDSRVQRGMLLYEKCTSIELRAFCKQRHIKIETGRVFKLDLIALLETADEDMVVDFEGFPAELRTMIYRHSFEFFRHETLAPNPPQVDIIHYFYGVARSIYRRNATGDDKAEDDPKSYDVFKLPPPPITRVNKTLRKESQCLYYENRILRFELDLSPSDTPGFKRWTALRGTDQNWGHVSLQHGKFFEKAPPELLRLVAKVFFNVRHHNQGRISRWEKAELKTDASLKSCVYTSVPTKPTTAHHRLLASSQTEAYQKIVSDDFQRRFSGLPNEDWLVALRTCLEGSFDTKTEKEKLQEKIESARLLLRGIDITTENEKLQEPVESAGRLLNEVLQNLRN